MTNSMQTQAREMKAMLGLLELAYERAQQEQAQVASEIEHVKAIQSELSAAAAQDTPSPGFRATGAEHAWRNWASTRQAAIMEELARLYAKREETKAQLRKDFGKLRAAQALAAKLEETAKRENAAKVVRILGEHITSAAVQTDI